jgi:hypothetical protein
VKATWRTDLKLRCAAGGAGLALSLAAASPALATDVLFSVGGASVAEGDSGQVDAVFTVTKSGPAVETTLDYTTQDGTALAGSDYVATSGTLTIPANALEASIVVKVNGDTEVEPDETFSVRISNPSVGFTVAPDTGQGTVLNDDQVPPPSGELQQGTSGDDTQHGTAGDDIQFGGGGEDTQGGGAGDDVQWPDSPPNNPVCTLLLAQRAAYTAMLEKALAPPPPFPVNPFLVQTLEAARALFDPFLANARCAAAKPPALPMTFQAKSQSLDDRLRGGSGDDVQQGGAGRDRIEGGPGRDLVIAGRGADRIDVKGGGKDAVDCGPGKDVVRSDSKDLLLKNCE